MPSRRRVADAVWGAGLALGTWAAWYALIVRRPWRMRFEATDLFVYFLPAYIYEAARLRELSLPLWNPYQGMGVPFLATLQPGALYPARLLLLLTDVPTAMGWSNIGHLVLLVLATYALCRTLGARPAGATIGAAVFVIACGRWVLFTPSFLEASPWFPVAALAAERVIATGRWRWVTLLGIAAAMPVLAGGYQASVYAAYALAVFVLAILCDPGRRGERAFGPIVGQLVVAGVLALGLAAPQLLTTLSWSAETVRQTGHLENFQIAPLAFTPWPIVLVGKLRQLTVPAAILAAVGFAASGRFGAVLGAFTVAACMLSLGPGAPGFGVYHLAPGLGMFRGPGRIFTTFVAFLCAIGAALGFTAIIRARWLERGRWRPAVEVLGLVLVLSYLVPKLRTDAVLPWTSTENLYLVGLPGMFPPLRASDARVALFGYPGDWAVMTRQGMMQGFRVMSDYEPLASRRLRDYTRALLGSPPTSDAVIPFTGGIIPREPLAHPELLDLVAVRHLVLRKDSPARERTPPLVHSADFEVYDLFVNPSALPRAYLADRARVVADSDTALATLIDPGFDGHREAVIVGDDEETAPLRLAASSPVRAARLALDEPERVAIEFETDHDALLVLTDLFAPGWSVEVDGTSRRLRQANHLVRGVVVHAGERRAEFTYRAPGLRLGAAAAGLGVATVALCATVSAWRRRRRGGEA